ncbi:MAG: serine/threonine-protein kinase [Polyangiaceae bacterium]
MGAVIVKDRIYSPGQMCGPYEIVQRIGRGGYGEVYEAIDASDQRVALKVVRIAHERDRRAAERQLLETRVLKQLDHVNVVGYRNAGITDDVVWLAMELLEGKTLHQVLRAETRLPLSRGLRIARQVCTALVQAHGVGVVHRDIKPGNIFILPGHVVKLLDFGIAKVEHVSLGTTQAVGTPLYMSPDYLRRGPDAEADPRWDLYALAMVTYQCIAGHHPFVREGDDQPSLGTIVARHMNAAVPPLHEVMPGCPERVSAAIARGLEKKVKAGWQTAADFEAELVACCQLVRELGERPDERLEARMRALMTPEAPTRPTVDDEPTTRDGLAAQVVTAPLDEALEEPAPRMTQGGTHLMDQPEEVLQHRRAAEAAETTLRMPTDLAAKAASDEDAPVRTGPPLAMIAITILVIVAVLALAVGRLS